MVERLRHERSLHRCTAPPQLPVTLERCSEDESVRRTQQGVPPCRIAVIQQHDQGDDGSGR
jgi:hypothetical protein